MIDYKDTSKNLAHRAFLYAFEKHKGQTRKYTGEAYIEHPIRVADTFRNHFMLCSDGCIAIAYLHDTVEDTSATVEEIDEIFGQVVASGVERLTNAHVGNRTIRNARYNQQLSDSSSIIQNIKICDMQDNVDSIVEYDPKFASVYLVEKLATLDVLTNADERMSRTFRKILNRKIKGVKEVFKGKVPA